MDIDEQIEYWRTGSGEDLAAAESLLEKGYLRHCLFLAYWALEKMLKAHVTRQTRDVPSRIHNLPRLAGMTGLKFDDEQMNFLREFGAYQLDGRYPDAEQLRIDEDVAGGELRKTREMLEWLGRQL